MRRRLIVTADDLGVSPEVNEAVLLAHRGGILRFASLMVNEPFAREAAERARRECPRLGVGLHLVLCSGRSALGPGAVPELVDASGRFPEDPVRCGLRYFFRPGLAGPLEREMRAQFERFLAFGLPPGHVDGHLNVHAHPVVFRLLARLAREYGFTRVRLPGGEAVVSFGFSARPWKQFLEAPVFSLMRRYLLRGGVAGLEVPERVWGLLRSGLMGEAYVARCLGRLPVGTTEMYFHPSADPASAVSRRPTPTHRTVTELETLLSPRLRLLLEREGIELVEAGGAG